MKLIVRSFLVLVAVWASILVDSPTSRAQNIKTCDDFTYQEDAQEYFDDGGGRPEDWYSGMDADRDGIACEDNRKRPIYRTSPFWIGVGAVVVATGGGVAFWWSRKVKAANATRDDVVLFPGRSSREEVEDALEQLKIDAAIDGSDEQTPRG